MNADDALDGLERIHDDEPQRAAAGLRELDAQALAADRLPLFAFLLNHVLGEKLAAWQDAAGRLEALRAQRSDAPLAVAVQAAVASELAGAARGAAFAALAGAAGHAAAEAAVDLAKLGFRAPESDVELAAELHRLARAAQQFEREGPLDQRLAIGFNNATSQLLDRATDPVDERIGTALIGGSAAALRLWLRAGTWVQHERALYLQALVFNRLGEAAAARDACNEALALIEANGGEDVDRVFLQLQLAGALQRLGRSADGGQALASARAAAAAWDDEALKTWFAAEQARLFGTSTEKQE